MGCGGGSSATAAPAAALGEMRIHTGPFSERHLLTGELVAEDAVYLVTPNTNQWPVTIQWLVEDGTEVAAGDAVVEFDNSQLTNNLEELTSRLVEANNELMSVRSREANTLAEAAFALQQQQAAYEKAALRAQVPNELSSRQDAERLRLELAKAKLSLDDATQRLASQRLAGDKAVAIQQQAVDKAQRSVRRSDDDLGKLRLTAPRDGLVLVARNREGRTYQSSDTAIPGSAVASMPDMSSLMVEARLFDVDDAKLAVGQPVRVTLDAFPEETMAGAVREISDYADQESTASTRRAFTVRIDVEGIDPGRMRPGMSVSVELDSPAVDALLVPRAALLWPSTMDAESGVETILGDGSRVPLELGPCNPTHCVVVDGPAAGTPLRWRSEGPR